MIGGGECLHGGRHANGERTLAVSACQTWRDVLVDAREPVGAKVRHSAHDSAFRAHIGDLVVGQAGVLQPGFHEGKCPLGSRDPV